MRIAGLESASTHRRRFTATGLVVQDSAFVNHTARPGGALFVDASEGVQLRRLQIRSGGGIFIAACKDKTTLSDATLVDCSSGGKGGAIHVVGSELVAQRVYITPNKVSAASSDPTRTTAHAHTRHHLILNLTRLCAIQRTSVRCEGQASVIDVDGTLLLSKACTNSDTNRPHSERVRRSSPLHKHTRECECSSSGLTLPLVRPSLRTRA